MSQATTILTRNADPGTGRVGSVWGWCLLVWAVQAISGCMTVVPLPAPVEERAALAVPKATEVPRPVDHAIAKEPDRVLARGERFILYRSLPGETSESLAKQVLGGEQNAWILEEVNSRYGRRPDEPWIVPLGVSNPVSVWSDGYQTVPILCYHRIGNMPGKVNVTPEAFHAQMQYLASNGYRVIPLRRFVEFLYGRGALPRRAVVITVDDGHQSGYSQAFPILRRFGFPATFFVYTDVLNQKGSLTWQQLREMQESGLIDIQPHSKSHEDLAKRRFNESDAQYAKRLEREAELPRDVLEQKLESESISFAYPYGSSNVRVMSAVGAADYRVAVTVKRGANTAFEDPLLLRRSMIFRGDDLNTFARNLVVWHPLQ